LGNFVFFEVIPPIWRLTKTVDIRIEPHVIARDTDYAGFIDEIQNTGDGRGDKFKKNM